MSNGWLRAALLSAVTVLTYPARATADDPAPTRADPAVEEARKAFAEGTELVRVAKYGDALARFELSAAKRPHAITLYNIGFCERALGRYTRARAQLRAALARNDQAPDELPPQLVSEAKANLDEIERLLAHAEVVLEPTDATITVDGRPLGAAGASGAKPVFVAGLLPPDPSGVGTAPGARELLIELDPGPHLVTVAHAGFDNALFNETYAPGERRALTIVMSQLPATMHVRAGQAGAVVSVDGRDVGVVPLDVRRPAGTYELVVAKEGFVTYREQVPLRPGQELDVAAPLPKERSSILTKWWFWTAAGVLVAGAAATTYALTRPSTVTERPPPEQGGLRWVVPLQ